MGIDCTIFVLAKHSPVCLRMSSPTGFAEVAIGIGGDYPTQAALEKAVSDGPVVALQLPCGAWSEFRPGAPVDYTAGQWEHERGYLTEHDTSGRPLQCAPVSALSGIRSEHRQVNLALDFVRAAYPDHWFTFFLH